MTQMQSTARTYADAVKRSSQTDKALAVMKSVTTTTPSPLKPDRDNRNMEEAAHDRATLYYTRQGKGAWLMWTDIAKGSGLPGQLACLIRDFCHNVSPLSDTYYWCGLGSGQDPDSEECTMGFRRLPIIYDLCISCWRNLTRVRSKQAFRCPPDQYHMCNGCWSDLKLTRHRPGPTCTTACAGCSRINTFDLVPWTALIPYLGQFHFEVKYC
jgi:hypothetical protein